MFDWFSFLYVFILYLLINELLELISPVTDRSVLSTVMDSSTEHPDPEVMVITTAP